MEKLDERNSELAVLKIALKEIKERIEALESPIKRELLEDFTENRSRDRVPVYIGGTKVGNYHIIPPKLEPMIIPGREDEAISFLQSLGLTQPQPVKHWEDAFVNVGGRAVHQASGAVCEAIEYEYAKPAFVRSDGFKRETVKDALQAVGITVPETFIGYLTEGE